MKLSRAALPHLLQKPVLLPPPQVFELPEKVLQFGTGVLLRGLPDYFIDKANRVGIFNGRIVVVKSTESGDATAFAVQDGLYTLCIRGVEGGETVSENQVCSAISRVLSAKADWDEVLRCAASDNISVIISNTTEVGLQLVLESIFQNPPQSFPAKLLAVLHARFENFGNRAESELVVLPTELISENGNKLQSIVTELAKYNNLDAAFFAWLQARVHFCNTLVDCIVPGKPAGPLLQQLETELGYTDELLAVSEAYRLWAIEGSEHIKSVLSFAQVDARIIITPDITLYKELKLRLLNGTHTISCGLAFLAGETTVKDAMANKELAHFISQIMLHEIAPAIPFALPDGAAETFGTQVLDRFRNPYLQHAWLSITLQYTSKMAMRVVPVLVHYIQHFHAVPQKMALGFAAYLLFMKSVKKEGEAYFGKQGETLYRITDAAAPYYFSLWQQHNANDVVSEALRNKGLWGVDLTLLPQFEATVQAALQQLLTEGAMQTLVQSNAAHVAL